MTKTDNELIAEFMGHERQRFDHNYSYDQSWSDLMPVVEKIYRMPDKDIRFKMENSRCRLWYGHKLFKCHTIKPLNSVYQVVVEFIKWYNSQSENA